MHDPVFTGRCLCGAVRFEISEPPHERGLLPLHALPAADWHRRISERLVDGGAFPITQGEELLKTWRHPDGWLGEGVLLRVRRAPVQPRPGRPREMGIRMAAFDGDPGVRPIVPPVRRVRGGLGADPR